MTNTASIVRNRATPSCISHFTQSGVVVWLGAGDGWLGSGSWLDGGDKSDSSVESGSTGSSGVGSGDAGSGGVGSGGDSVVRAPVALQAL